MGPLKYLELDCMRSLGVERRSIEAIAINSLDFSGGRGFEFLPAY